jgi:hypothetical protein
VRNAAERKPRSLAGKLNFGTLGPDTTTDISRRYLNELWKSDIIGIHYKGSPQIITALAGRNRFHAHQGVQRHRLLKMAG